jgi:acyl-CoA thioester hydrolase
MLGSMEKQPAERRAGYLHFERIPTRWSDNDLYGHVNNIVYYSYFDTVINRYLIDAGGLDIERDQAIGVCVESGCRYRAPISFPEPIDAGLRVGKLGSSSVRFEVGIFRAEEDEAAAAGHFVHVFVDRLTRRPTPIPERIRAALARLQRGPA